MVDEHKLNAFMEKMLGDLGGALSVSLVRIGDRLGLYRALHEHGPLTSAGLAETAGIAPRYAREWCAQQAASGYLAYHSDEKTFELPAEQAMVFALPDSPVYLQGAFDLAAAMVENQAPVEAAFKTGKGVGWGDQAQCLFCATGRFFRPAYNTHLLSSWLPALEGVSSRLDQGGHVADVGCGHGFSTIMMAKAFPKAHFTGYDFHEGSVAQARVHAEQHGVTANTRFEVAMASNFGGTDLDLVTFFDCLHDMGDPAGVLRPCPLDAEGRRDLDGGRAASRRPHRGQPQPDRAAVLRRLDDDLHTDLARPACRSGARCPGRLRPARRGDRAGWLLACAEGDGDAVQHGHRGAALR